MVTFAVDDVAPATEQLPTQPLSELYPDALAIGGDPARRVLAPNGVHPLLSAVGHAFADHRPLVLSPDAIWLTIAQGVAQHVRLNAEELRPLLVSHAGRKRVTVEHDGPMPHDAESWQFFVEKFAKQLAAEISDAEIFECDFTTSTSVERTAGQVVLLDAYSPFFSHWLAVICGIPSITLTGTVEDWRKIRDRVDYIEQLGLEKWCESLRPITDQFVRATSGIVEPTFWQGIYNSSESCGGDIVTGWIARLYPYLEFNGAYDRPNPMLDSPVVKPKVKRPVSPGGIHTDSVPSTLSKVIINVQDQDLHTVVLHSGLAGVAQDDDNALRPIAGWHLTRAVVEIDDVIDTLCAKHEVTPPIVSHEPPEGTPELVALDRRIGSAVLFGGAWRIRPVDDRPWMVVARNRLIQVVIDLADGRHIGFVAPEFAPARWAVFRVQDRRLADEPGNIPVYGTSLAILLEAAMDFGGDISSLETGTLADLAC